MDLGFAFVGHWAFCIAGFSHFAAKTMCEDLMKRVLRAGSNEG